MQSGCRFSTLLAFAVVQSQGRVQSQSQDSPHYDLSPDAGSEFWVGPINGLGACSGPCRGRGIEYLRQLFVDPQPRLGPGVGDIALDWPGWRQRRPVRPQALLRI